VEDLAEVASARGGITRMHDGVDLPVCTLLDIQATQGAGEIGTVMRQVMSRVKAARSADVTVDLVLGLSYSEFMSVTINVHAAKTQFSKLLARVIAGEEIIIAKAGKPVARLAPIGRQTAKKRVPGIDKGKIWMSKDFDVMTARELEDWYQTDNRLK